MGKNITWQDALTESTNLTHRSEKARKRAGILLWDGAKGGISEWLPNSEKDEAAEAFGQDVTAALGEGRKGDASKIKTVALAVKNVGLDLDKFANLSQAYAEATALTKTVKVHAAEDEAIEAAVTAIAADAPASAKTPESAAKILLAKGVEGAIVAILDALGADAFEAHRAFIRSINHEVSDRIKAKANHEKEEKAQAAEVVRVTREKELLEKQVAMREAAAAKAKESSAAKAKAKAEKSVAKAEDEGNIEEKPAKNKGKGKGKAHKNEEPQVEETEETEEVETPTLSVVPDAEPEETPEVETKVIPAPASTNKARRVTRR